MARRFILKTDPEQTPRLTIDYAAELNPQQFEAATAGAGASLIVAGAGTGKTRTLVYRVAYLVETGVEPEQIALLTFTRRAAREMTDRATRLLDGRCRRIRGGTFHSFCLEILARHAPRIGYPARFTILDAADAADVIDVLRTDMNLNRAETRFPRKGTIQAMFSAATNRDLPLEEVVEEDYAQFARHLDALHELRAAYAAYKLRHGLMDYDDLLQKTLFLFEEAPDVLRLEAGRCRHVLVDEYQDTNHLQAALVEQFASVHGNVTAVGDDAQSIYGFRGADYRNIFAFPEIYENARVYKLEQNYRSTQPVLDVANHIIRQAHERFEKELFTRKVTGEPPGVVPAPDERWEARFVAQMVLQLREDGVPLDRTAVLFRSAHNSFELEVELQQRGIPFVKYGGTRLMEAAHIKDVVAYLRILENPQDAVAWSRVLQLIDGIGPRSAQQIIERMFEERTGDFVLPAVNPSSRFAAILAELFSVLHRAADPDRSIGEQLGMVLDFYGPLMEKRYSEDFPRRRQDLDHFHNLAEPYGTRDRFLTALALDPIEVSVLDQEGSTADERPLVLSTIHSAKGLEFDTVFVIHLLDGVLPSSYALRDAVGVDEELRLLYVAVTRAEERLFLSYPVTQRYRRDADMMTRPSRFLDDLAEPMVEFWQLDEDREPPQLPPSSTNLLN
jgi:DNA helicase II / ATP-dependent DNA helicase PcrA